MNYFLLADCLWYLGHIFTGFSIVVNQHHYYLAVSFVLFGQFITIISRPIGRIKTNEHKIAAKTEEGEFNDYL